MKRVILIFIITLFVVGCKTSKTKSIEATMFDGFMDDCYAFLLSNQQQQQAMYANITDTKDLMILALINDRSAPNMAHCDDLAITMLNSDAQTRAALIQGSFGLATFGLGAWAAASVVDSVADLGAAKGNTNIVDSRAIVESGNESVNGRFSSSGEGMGLGNVNTFDGSLGQGGIQPRQAIVNESTSVDLPSQSGTNEPPTINSPPTPLEE